MSNELLIGAIVAFFLAAIAAVFAARTWKRTRGQALIQEKAQLAMEHAATLKQLKADHDAQLAAAKKALDEAVAKDRAELKDLAAKLDKREDQIAEREKSADRALAAAAGREDRLRTQEEKLTGQEQSLAKRDQDLEKREADLANRWQELSGLTAEQAAERVLARTEAALSEQISRKLLVKEKELVARSKELAIEHVSRAIQRYAAEHTAESTFTKVKLPDEDAKGRIIGKEGRNIKAFEQVTGVDVVIDETPDAVTISCFDPVRREIGRRTLEILLEDGRIQPARIEEVQAGVQQEMDREVLRRGEEAAFACEVSGLHPQILKLLGKLHYRTSYGQNVLKHSQEVAWLCSSMAADLGLDPKLGRRCGLLHDVGKAIDHEQEGSHPQLGYEALKRWNESEIVANAALAHHEGHQPISAYTVLAAAGDAISAARPGARNHNTENYLKRLSQLESIACNFPGVQKAYAIQAGRELRVMVDARSVPDAQLPKLSHDIATAISDNVAFPGEVKVTCIRELRHFSVAR